MYCSDLGPILYNILHHRENLQRCPLLKTLPKLEHIWPEVKYAVHYKYHPANKVRRKVANFSEKKIRPPIYCVKDLSVCLLQTFTLINLRLAEMNGLNYLGHLCQKAKSQIFLLWLLSNNTTTAT